MQIILRALVSLLIFTAPCVAQNAMFFGASQGPTSAPSHGQDKACQGFGSPQTCTFSATVTVGQIINYYAAVTDVTSTITVTDNCNTGGSSNTYTKDKGPTTQSTVGEGQAGHATVGATTASCTVSVAWSGASAAYNVVLTTISGSTGLDLAATLNGQSNPGSGANTVMSNAITTTHTDFCVAYTSDVNVSETSLTPGTTLAWTAGATITGYPTGSEYFTQSSPGSITATFGIGSGFTEMITGISCYHS